MEIIFLLLEFSNAIIETSSLTGTDLGMGTFDFKALFTLIRGGV